MPGRAPAARPSSVRCRSARGRRSDPTSLLLAQLAPVPRTPRQPRARHGRRIGPLRASGTRRSPAGLLIDHRGHRGRPPWRPRGSRSTSGPSRIPEGCGSPMTARLTRGAQEEQLLRICPERSARAWGASTGRCQNNDVEDDRAAPGTARRGGDGCRGGGTRAGRRRPRGGAGAVLVRHGAAGAEGAGERLRLPHAHLRRPLPGRCQRDVAAAGRPRRRLPPPAAPPRHDPERGGDSLDLRHRQPLHARRPGPARRRRAGRGGGRHQRRRTTS